jgi:hypothetical protein
LTPFPTGSHRPREPHPPLSASPSLTAMESVANRNGRISGGRDHSRGRFATYAAFPRHDCSPYSHVHARRDELGFVPRSRASFCRPVPNPTVTIRKTFPSLCAGVSPSPGPETGPVGVSFGGSHPEGPLLSPGRPPWPRRSAFRSSGTPCRAPRPWRRSERRRRRPWEKTQWEAQ